MEFSLHEDVIERLKTADPDRVRAAMFAEPDIRARLLLIYAFHLELAKVPELVSEPMIGQIRYQWWRDAIAEIYETESVKQHEITTPLKRLLLDYNIPRYWVDQLIDGRERDIDPRPFAGLTEALDYCANTSGVLMKIATKLCGVDPSETEEAAGIAWGLTGLARAYGYYHETILSEVSFKRLLELANQKQALVRQSASDLDIKVFPAVGYAALVPHYISKMSHKNHDPVTMQVSYSPLSKKWHLLKASLIGKL